MKIICYELTMPNVGSWNGKWSLQEEKHLIFKSVGIAYFRNNEKKLIGSWYYNFGDGWGANVEGKVITSVEKAKLKKLNKGFCGYNWMVDSIMLVGEIYNSRDLKDVLNKVKINV